MNMFDEIDRLKINFPKVKTVTKNFVNYNLNGYQSFAVIILIICIGIGIFLGNLFPVCGSSSFYDQCSATEFNFALMLGIWIAGLFVCIFFFAIGHIIRLLTEISNKLPNK